jgi:heat shock protein HslJ
MKTYVRVAVAGLVLFGVFALVGCKPATPAVDPGALEGVEWSLIGSSMSSTDLGAAGITANFDGTQLSGFSGVNQYSGPYTAGTDGSLKIGELAGTLMAGPEPLMKAESAYLELLKGCDSYRVESGKLTLSTGGTETLIYEKAKAAALPGTKWVVTGYNNGKEAVVSVALDSTLTAEFGTDGTMSGDGGVNIFNGPFESASASVTIGPLASTMMAGPEELMTQEALYLQALQNSVSWSIRQGRLEMRDAAGAMQVTAQGQ